jgi:hypothetical protein
LSTTEVFRLKAKATGNVATARLAYGFSRNDYDDIAIAKRRPGAAERADSVIS